MHIAVLRLESTGARVRIDRILHSLAERHEVTYIAPRRLHTDTYAKQLAEETMFIGLGRIRDEFVRARIQPYYWWVKRRVSRLLRRARPDIVYAINVYSAVPAIELGYSVAVDDRELYSLKEYVNTPRGKPLESIRLGRSMLMYRWMERFVAENAASITVVSEPMAEYYRGLGASRVYVVPNYPSHIEIRGRVIAGESGAGICYIGGCGDLDGRVRHRDVSIFIRVLEETRGLGVDARMYVLGCGQCPRSWSRVECIGYVEHSQLFEKMHICRYGFLAWPPSPYNRYLSPLKGYMYLHAGLVPIVTSDMEHYIGDLRRAGIEYVEAEASSYMDSLRQLGEALGDVETAPSEVAEKAKLLVWENIVERLYAAIDT